MLVKEYKKRFHVVLVKPSKYDEDGYVIRWWKAVVTSNSLACLNALTEEARAREVLGPETEIIIHLYDETVEKVPVRKLAREIRKAGEAGVVGLVGVQSNQFPRALDLAREFRKEGLPSMIGGFHVSGTVAMLPKLTPELETAMDEGITLVAGEVEKNWADILKDARENRLKPLYNYLQVRPELAGMPSPFVLRSNLRHFIDAHSSFDAGRGCPFHCSFCTIINVQGNKMRARSAEDIEALIRRNHAQGITHFFITDDNFARNPEWEKIADRLIDLKEKEGLRSSIMIQTDVLAHKIPRFIEKMAHAGCRRVFIGMESVNPENLAECGKQQNKVGEYRRMLQAWRDQGVITCAGYIIGFPNDTPESIRRDVEFLKREIPLDMAEFFIWTPLPGSEDHQRFSREGVWMDPDLNRYDSAHAVIRHPKMSREELERAYHDAWRSFFSPEHYLTLFKRRKGPRRRLLFSSLFWFSSVYFLTNVHPLLGGYFRMKGRKNRRPGTPRESFLPYYLGRARELLKYNAGMLKLLLKFWLLLREARRPEHANYEDAAIRKEPPENHA